MEKKYHDGVNVKSGIRRPTYQPKVLQYSNNTSSIPRLPPILQKEVHNASPTLQKRKQTDITPRDFLLERKQPKTTLLPRLERSHFEASTVYFKTVKKEGSKLWPSEQSLRYEQQERNPVNPIDYLTKQDTSISNTILGIRKKKKDRLSSYKCSANSVIDDEISEFEQRVGFDAISTASSTTVKDMKGRMIQSGDAYNDGVSSLMTMIDEDEKTKNKSGTQEKQLDNKAIKKSRSTSLRERFLKALDVHFFNEFVNAKCGRRKAICEELEKTISGDGKASLTSLREHLRLQDVLDSWVL